MTFRFRDFLCELCLRKFYCTMCHRIFSFQLLYNIIMYHLLLHVTCSPSPLVSIKKITQSFRHSILVYNTFNNQAESTCSFAAWVLDVYLHIIIWYSPANWRQKVASRLSNTFEKIIMRSFLRFIFFLLLFIYSYYRRLSLPELSLPFCRSIYSLTCRL